jgi:hypothetical protein
MDIIIRHAQPNKFDQASKGTICRVINSMNKVNTTTLDNEIIEEYIQRSDDCENPRWEKV